MEPNTALRTTDSDPRFSLVETIADLNLEFSNVKIELRDAQRETNKLKSQLEVLRSRSLELTELDTAALRRHAAFYCHPDRGGDHILMQRLNVLFDLLEAAQ